MADLVPVVSWELVGGGEGKEADDARETHMNAGTDHIATSGLGIGAAGRGWSAVIRWERSPCLM